MYFFDGAFSENCLSSYEATKGETSPVLEEQS